MNLKIRLNKLEKTKRQTAAEVDCVCFPPDEPLHVELRAEMEAVAAVSCRIHGKRSSDFAPSVYRVVDIPTHLNPNWRTSHSAQYIKAMDASFPPDLWPATKIVEPDGAVRFVLKDGTGILRVAPPPEILEYKSPTAVSHVLKQEQPS